MDALVYQYTLASKRKGLLLHLKDQQGKSRWGEIAPLTGFSLETLDEATEQLKIVKERLVRGKELPDTLLPSVRFGVMSALFPAKQLSVPVAALLSGSAQEIVRQAESCIQKGFTTAKIKISSLNLSDARILLKDLKAHLRLRVDMNRAWPFKRAVKLFESFSETDFDFVEEPAQNPLDLLHFPLPIGVDETLRERPLDFILNIPTLKAFVYKPTLEGGMQKAIELSKHKIDLVLSSSYETGIGIGMIALFSSLLKKPLPALGLGTYNPSSDDLLIEPMVLSRGHLLVDPEKLKPKMEKLVCVN